MSDSTIASTPDGPGEPVPEWIGPYRLTACLGAGGMGEVYVAEQAEPVRRRVAIKLIKPGMDSRSLVARFRQEQQALALMQHDGIAKVHDVGTTERGQPYFVMELVEGVPLHQYCDCRRLALRQRLSLVQQVCAAVTHAHQKGVVHRDLKPGNILVAENNGAPQVKVIDFGLAKALGDKLTDATLHTEFGRMVGTPEYMAPEQAETGNRDIDTRADVYSLGVILYELLVGELPFGSEELRRGGIAGIQRMLREAEPPRPSRRLSEPGRATQSISALRQTTPTALQRLLRNDLDWVVLKAMEKDRERRYDSAAALAAELQRFLDDEPVLAGPPSTWYRLRKLARRHRGRVAAAGLVAAALLGGGGAAFVQWRRAEAAATANARLAQDKGALAEAEAAARTVAARLATEKSATVDRFNQLAGVVRLRDALDLEQSLWPAFPDQAPALSAWLRDAAAPLLAMRPKLDATLAALAAQALPLTPALESANRKASPEHADFLRLESMVRSMRRAQAIREGKQTVAVPTLPAARQAATAADLGRFAWARVAPPKADGLAPQRTIFGEEEVALAAARAAVAKSAGRPDEFEFLDILAWASLANGLDDEARRCIGDAVAKAPPEHQATFASRQFGVETGIVQAPLLLELAEATLAEADQRLAERRLWQFPAGEDGAALRFLHGALSDLQAGIAQLAARELPAVENRLAWANQLAAATRAHPRAHASWAMARDAIAKADGVVASERYAGRAIAIPDAGWIGLVPIGMNPVTRLWEFYDLCSAWDGVRPANTIEIPRHRADGTIAVGEATGIVFVLLPGGQVTIGAQDDDPSAPHYDPERQHDESLAVVELAPFLLARHELTRAQWRRLAGEQPSAWEAGTAVSGDREPIGPTHPADSMSWQGAMTWLQRHGMILPTEAQWEHGARGGTTTVRWPGSSVASLAGVDNLHDEGAVARNPQFGVPAPFRDGHVALAPVGCYRANPFGLHDILGNVMEWCQDGFGPYGEERAGDGLRAAPGATTRVVRGGSFASSPASARSAYRYLSVPTAQLNVLGVRPARLLMP
jgi:serine/threonine protein kinase/formylglycine-generating enzyme required for sulfatase activity